MIDISRIRVPRAVTGEPKVGLGGLHREEGRNSVHVKDAGARVWPSQTWPEDMDMHLVLLVEPCGF
jgi:hypothetical protein